MSRPVDPGSAGDPEGTPASKPERHYAPDFLTQLFQDPLDPGYADAAAGRSGDREARTWRWGTLRTLTLVTLVVTGMLFAMAYRKTVAEEPDRSQARAGLIAQIHEREKDADDLARRTEQLRREVSAARSAALTDTEAIRLRELEAVTGFGRVSGDGVVVRVADAPDAESANSRVLDIDLQKIANALWSAGAEAIAINGQRLTSTSTIRSAGGTILVDFRPVTGPYEVTAIGPRQMEREFSASETAGVMRRVVQVYGISFEIADADDLTLPAAAEPQLRYAEPLVTPDPTESGAANGSPPTGASPRPSSSGGG